MQAAAPPLSLPAFPQYLYNNNEEDFMWSAQECEIAAKPFAATRMPGNEYHQLIDTHPRQNRALLNHLSPAELEDSDSGDRPL